MLIHQSPTCFQLRHKPLSCSSSQKTLCSGPRYLLQFSNPPSRGVGIEGGFQETRNSPPVVSWLQFQAQIPWKPSQFASYLIVKDVFLLFEDLLSLQSTTDNSYSRVHLVCKKHKRSKSVSYLGNTENMA